MEITITIATGLHNRRPVKKDIDRNIQALTRAIEGKHTSIPDTALLIDTRSILEGIKSQLSD